MRVCDASAVVAALLDAGSDGQWASEAISGADLAAPSVFPFEAANIIRRHARAELISAEYASQAHRDLLDLPVEEWPYALVADRYWELRHNLTAYDASYVAVAELLGAPLVTLDRGIGRISGLACTVMVP